MPEKITRNVATVDARATYYSELLAVIKDIEACTDQKVTEWKTTNSNWKDQLTTGRWDTIMTDKSITNKAKEILDVINEVEKAAPKGKGKSPDKFPTVKKLSPKKSEKPSKAVGVSPVSPPCKYSRSLRLPPYKD